MRILGYVLSAVFAAALSGCSNNSGTSHTANKSVVQQSKGLPGDTLVKRLVRAGELEVSGEDLAEAATYFDTVNFRFHGPSGYESDYNGLSGYFKSVRAAFDDRSIKRGIIVKDGNYVSCQTWIQGTFVRTFTHSPAGPLQPNGKKVVFELINIFKFDDQGRLIEEWVQTDNRSVLKQLGAEGK